MAGETTLTLIGNLTNDPELRFTPAGKAVSNFTIASTPREFDRQTNAWKDGETLFLRANVWNEQAENVAESLTKGMRVIASGRLKSRSYETKEGEKRTVMEFEVDEIGPSLKYANAKVNRTQRSNQGGQQNGNDYAPAQGGYNTRQGNQPQGQPGGQQSGYGGQWGANQQQPPQQGQGGPSGQWGTGADPGVNQGFQQPQQQAYAQGNQPSTPQQQQPPAQQNDPWGAPVGQQNPGTWGNGGVSDPPF